MDHFNTLSKEHGYEIDNGNQGQVAHINMKGKDKSILNKSVSVINDWKWM